MVRFKAISVLIVLLALPVFLFAQETQPTQPAQQPSGAQTGMVMRMQDTMGMQVANEAGDLQGQIQDFVIWQGGDIRYLVVSFQPGAQAQAGAQTQQGAQTQPEQMAQAGNMYLVPVDRATWDATGQRITLNINQSDLQTMQMMQDGELPPDLASAMPGAAGATGAADTGAAPATPPADQTQGAVAQAQPSDQAQAAPATPGAMDQFYLGSKLQGITVMSSDNQELGTIEGAMLNLQSWRVEYFALSPANVLGLTEQLYSITPDVLTEINIDQGQATANISADQLGQRQGFSGDNWPQQATGGQI